MTRVFISHSNRDRERIEREIIAPLREHGFETWYSREDIHGAAAWERRIREALEQCDWFVVALTPSSVASEWVQTEVHWALEQRPGQVVPVLLEACDPTQLHLKLVRIQHIDFTGDAAEARARLLAVWGLKPDPAADPLRSTNAPIRAGALQRFLHQLQHRGVVNVAAIYGIACFILLQAADLILAASGQPEWLLQLLLWAALAGYPLALTLSWYFDITPHGVRRARLPHDVGHAATTVRSRFKLLSLAVVGVLMTIAGGLAAVRARLDAPQSRDGRIALAIFPFRTVGAERAEWSEGIADLLATALDGTEGIRVVDPWSLWNDLREPAGAPATSPDPTTAASLARAAGARRVLLGSVVMTGDSVDLSLRIYDPRFARPLDTFALRDAQDGMTALVRRLAVEVITRVWDGEAVPGTPPLEARLTASPEALKAFLAAKVAMRRGMVDSASTAIDRAIALDSTFALALHDAVGIRSWQLSMTGRPYAGFFELLERAMAHDDALSQRHQLRLEAMLAAVQTRGAAAAQALSQIIEIDSTDLQAWTTLAYVHNTYGWQYGASTADAIAAADRVVRLDSSYVPGLVSQAWLRLSISDSIEAMLFVERLLRADTLVPMARSALLGLRAIAADGSTFQSLAHTIAGTPPTEWIPSYRYIRAYHPARAEALLTLQRANAEPGAPSNTAAGEYARLLVAEGRFAAVDSALRTPEYQDPALYWGLQRLLAASALAGVGDSVVARRSVDALARFVPADSALAYFETRPAWWVAWLVGAYHAQQGDTLVARRYQRAIGTFPAGGSPATYREALQADLESRLAARSRDVPRALASARRAFDLWNIHTEQQSEAMPEPAIRFHLAMLLKQSGDAPGAEEMLRSLVPPVSWMGFLTPRAAFELGDLASARGDVALAKRHYSMALRYWERGGREIEPWRSQLQSRLTRIMARTSG